MYYVYLLQSIHFPSKKYIGFTGDLKKRLIAHNSGASLHTAKYKPWNLIVFIGFVGRDKAVEFEKYLKSRSGRVFIEKRLW
jgi:putative endonuclease